MSLTRITQIIKEDYTHIKKPKHMKQISLSLLFSLCFILNSFAQIDSAPSQEDLSNIPASNGYVNDFADILSEQEEAILEKYLETYEVNSAREIAVVSVQSLDGHDNIADFSTDLMNKWGVGQDKLDNGLIILIAPNERKMRIGTGLTTENIITDQICTDVLNQQMIPFFKQGHFYEGILTGIVLLQEHWGEATEAEVKFLDALED